VSRLTRCQFDDRSAVVEPQRLPWLEHVQLPPRCAGCRRHGRLIGLMSEFERCPARPSVLSGDLCRKLPHWERSLCPSCGLGGQNRRQPENPSVAGLRRSRAIVKRLRRRGIAFRDIDTPFVLAGGLLKETARPGKLEDEASRGPPIPNTLLHHNWEVSADGSRDSQPLPRIARVETRSEGGANCSPTRRGTDRRESGRFGGCG
jgi:hypothetical protein